MFRQESICQFVNRRGWLIAVFLILIGGSIYIVYRPKSIIIFRVIDYFGLTDYVDAIRNNLQEFLILPPIFVNSIPAGLWTTSYLILMYCNTRFMRRKHECTLHSLYLFLWLFWSSFSWQVYVQALLTYMTFYVT